MRPQLFLTFLACFICAFVSGQSPSVIWSNTYGGPNGDYAWSIDATSDGGYIVAGYVESAGGDITGYHGNAAVNDIWVIKLDVNGKLQWQRCIGGMSLEKGGYIKQTADGGYILGASTASGACGKNGIYNTQYWLVKLTSSGDVQWQKQYGGSDADDVYAMDVAPDGGYIIVGSSASTNGDVTGNHGINDYWVVKADAGGNLQWQKSLGGTQPDGASAVKSLPDGNFLVGGQTQSNDGDVSGNHGNGDAWLVKLDGNGNIIWQKCYGGSGSDRISSIALTNDGNYIIGASSSSNNGDVTGAKGGNDFWLLKINSAGNILWQKSYGGSRNDNLYAVKATLDGGYVAVGSVESLDGDVTCNAGYEDMWIVKTDATGNRQWQKSMGGELQDHAYAVQPLNDGNYIVAGITCSRAIHGYHTPTLQHSCPDYWVVKLSPGGMPAVPPTIAIDANTTTVCSGTLSRVKANALNAGIAPSYQWSRNGVPVGYNQPYYEAADFSNNESISVTVTSGGPCETVGAQALAVATIQINTNFAQPSITISTPSSIVCACSVASFHANVANGGVSPNFQWMINGQLAGNNLPDFAEFVSPGDRVACVLSDNSVCGGSAASNVIEMTAGNNIPPTLSISSPTKSICSGTSLTFTAVPVNAIEPHFQWQVNGINAGTDSTGFTSSNFLNGDVVSCTINSSSASQCFSPGSASSNSIIVTVTPNINPSIDINSISNVLCEGKFLNFKADFANAGTNPVFEWKVNGMTANATGNLFNSNSLHDNDSIVCVMVPGTGACRLNQVVSNTVIIALKPSPEVVVFPMDTVILIGTSVQLTSSVTGSIDQFTWTPSLLLQNPTSLNPSTKELSDDASFTLSVHNEFGCTSTATAKINIKPISLFIPNAFTPNGDGLNDVFRIPSKADLTLKEFSIYDRWGKRVFVTRDRNEGWDGKLNGQLSPPGVYVYTVSGADRNGALLLKGTVVLVR